jgi:hypothetical protein
MQTKKGFILIYTILVGLICLIVMMYIFDIQMAEIKYSKNIKTYVLKEDNYQKHKEYLKTLFFAYIDVNSEQIRKVGINEFFYNFKNDIVVYDKAKVNYSRKTNEFAFVTPYEIRKNRNDYFKIEIIDERFQLIYIKTDYTN